MKVNDAIEKAVFGMTQEEMMNDNTLANFESMRFSKQQIITSALKSRYLEEYIVQNKEKLGVFADGYLERLEEKKIK